MDIRVRYAPSPTGHLHIGNARTALFNYLFAKRKDGTFIVRIEDTDTERNVETGIESQLDHLAWLGITPDETIGQNETHGPYRQLERLDIYRQHAEALMEKGLAYKCYCTKAELEAEREAMREAGEDKLHYSRKCLGLPDQDKPYAIRFKVPNESTYPFEDIVKGDVRFSSDDIGDWVIVKQNGIPTYNFACAIDDHLMEISHVLRGEDHITNTPKQLMVFDAFGWTPPTYGHMTLIVNTHGKKLSKRDESILQFIEQYRALGYLPEAMFNFIALLGFSPDAEREIFTPEELVERFDERRLSTSPATFDAGKLAFINNRYIKTLSLEATVALCRPFLEEAGIGQGQDDDWMESLVAVFKDRLSYGKQIVNLYDDFFNRPFAIEPDAMEIITQTGVDELIRAFTRLVEQSTTLDADTYKALIKDAGNATGMKGKMLFMPIRIAISGTMHGPDLPKMMHLLGRDVLIERLEQTLTIRETSDK